MGSPKQQTKPPNISLSPSLSSSPPTTKFHQRLSHSFLIRTSTSTNTNDLRRRQSLVDDEKKRRPSMGNINMLMGQQRASIINTDSSLANSIFKTPLKTSKISSSTKELPFEACSSSYSPLDRLKASSSSPPSLNEFYLWVSEYVTPLSRMNHIITIDKLLIAKECLYLLLDNVEDETFESKNTLKNQLHRLKIPRQQGHPASYSVLAGILKYLLHILTTLQPTIHNSFKLIDSADTPSSYTLEPTCIITSDCDALWPDHLDRKTHWFRTFFYGNDYLNIFVPILLNKHSSSPSSTTTHAIVTAIQEPILVTTTTTTTNVIRSNQPTTTKMDPCQYRLIIRHSNRTIRQVVSSSQAYHFLTGKQDNQKSIKHQRRSLRGYQQQQDRVLAAAISSVCPELDMTKAVYLTPETTMAIQLEKDLLHLDGIEIPPSYKFGVLTIKDDQTTEEEWFSNTGLTPSFDHFLNVIGDRIQLKDYNGYSAGLDTKTGETGNSSVVSRWKDYQIMYHVAPLMPYRQNDKQQVQRKRFIGNDIVCLVFLEGDAIFDPKAIRSKFLHVYIVVRRETIGAKHRWRIEVVRKNNVPEFGPSLPNPPLFYDDISLQKFLTVKLINAENASLKCDNFSIPNNRARAGILESMVEKGLTQNKLTNKSTLKRHKSQSQRHTDRLSRGSFHNIRSNTQHHDTTTNSIDPLPTAPPIPSPTRSTILQDLKNFALRRTPTLPSLQLRSTTITTSSILKEEPITPPDDTDTDDEKKKHPFHFTNSLLSGSSVHHGGVPNSEPMMQRSFLATKAKLQSQTGGRNKADNLMINMVGRRSTSSSKPLSSSLPK